MLLSTKGRYGLKASLELAFFYGKGPINLKSISEKYSIPESYLEQLLGKLKKSGYIETIRGKQGGYLLAKEPKDITVGMILRALEGDISSSDCLKNDKCGKENTCVTRIIFEDIEKSINNIIDNTTLQDMVQKRNEFPKEARQWEKYILTMQRLQE